MNPAGQPDAHVYNNVFIMKENVPFIRPGMGGGPMIVPESLLLTCSRQIVFCHVLKPLLLSAHFPDLRTSDLL